MTIEERMNVVKNKEFYMDEIIDLISGGYRLTVKDGAPAVCQVSCWCDECPFYEQVSSTGKQRCSIEKFKKWANEEHVEHEVDWQQVPVDTPIYVWDDGKPKTRRHFCKVEGDVVYAWMTGKTSFTCAGKSWFMAWDHAELAEPHPEYMKKI